MKFRDFTTRSGTHLSISELGFGAAPIGDLYEKLPERQAFDTVQTAYESGIRLFDSSPHYGNGLSELRTGAALRDYARDSFLLSTKVGRWMNAFEKTAPPSSEVYSPGFVGGTTHRPRFDYSYDGVMRSVEQSLLRMGTDHIDILLIHDADVWTHGENYETHFAQAMSGAYPALERLRAEGAVKAIGVGINEADVCERFAREGDFDLMLMASQYSLLQQPALKSFLPLAEQKKIGIMLGGVFSSGILATGAVPGAKFNYKTPSPSIIEKVNRIDALCAHHGVSMRHVAMRFALSHPAVVSIVLGGVHPTEVKANTVDVNQTIPTALWRDLKSEGLLDPAAPTPHTHSSDVPVAAV